jgi:iron complex transport system substrate-binding protein
VASDSKWAGLPAVSTGQIYNIPIGATRFGQRGDVETYFAMLWLGCTLYPQYYSDVDFKDRLVSHYRDYLGVEVDDALFEKIMSGEGIRSEGTGGGGL